MKPMSPNDLGNKPIVEHCQKIDIKTFLDTTKRKLKEVILRSELDIAGLEIELTTSRTGFGGVRYWFKCPLCSSRVGNLYIHPVSSNLGCRECLGLEYKKRRYKGMLESEV
jgi:hypothetical protein